MAVQQRLIRFLESSQAAKGGQNFLGFDAQLLNRVWGATLGVAHPQRWGFVIDTMVAHHLVMSVMPHGLAFLSSIFTDMGPYILEVHRSESGDDFQKWEQVKDYEDERLRTYCMRDCFATAMAARVLLEMME